MYKRVIVAVCIFFAGVVSVRGQEMSYEIGINLGAAHHFTDIGYKAGIMANTGVVAGGVFKANFNPRIALRINGTWGKVSLDDTKSSNTSVKERAFKENISFFEFAPMVEFNFLPFDMKKRLPHTPYVFAGAGLMVYGGRKPIDLTYWDDPIQIYDERFSENKTMFAAAIPLGVGYKLKTGRLVAGVELRYDYMLTDNFDASAPDPAYIRDNRRIRIGQKSNDSYMSLGISLTYLFFGPRGCFGCFR